MNPRSPDHPQEVVQTGSTAAGTGVVSTLVQAFATDPVANHLFPDPAQRTPGMAHVFGMAVRLASKVGLIDVIQPDQAAAIWMRPAGSHSSWRRILASGALATPFVVGWSATQRLLHYERFVEGFRERQMAGRPHWYLFAIGTRPEAMGAGFGSALLSAGRRRAAAEGYPCVLETSNQRNLAFYQKNGFSIVGQDRLPDSDLTVWSLISDPSPGPGPDDGNPPRPYE